MIRALSLRLRITLSLIVAIVLILGSTTLLIDSNVDREVAERADANLLERAQALADVFSANMKASPQPFHSHRMPSFLAEERIAYFAINCEGQRVTSSDEASTLPWPTAVAGRSLFANMLDPKGFKLRAVVLRFSPELDLQRGLTANGDHVMVQPVDHASPDCDLGLAVSRHEVRHFQEYLDRIEIGCVVLGFLAVIILVPLLVTRGLQPLSQLAEAMNEIGPETPEMRLGGIYAYELRPLVTRFNEVLSRMEDGLLRERQFASGVAHELRTPLAELRTAIEVELRYPSGRDLRTLLADMGDIGIEMEKIVTSLLLLTRIDAGIERLQLQSVNVATLTQRLVDRYQRSIQKRQIGLKVQLHPNAVWLADAGLLDVIFSNLLGNAVAYAPVGSEVTLRCDSEIWCVRNLAPDLTEQDVEFMGQRFWRKGKDAGVHTGIGLSLAASAARAQALKLDLSLHDEYLHAGVSCQSGGA
jgi:two-component system sensor histidine kinase QseC